MSVLWLQVLLMLGDINKEGLTVVVKSDLPILLLFSFIHLKKSLKIVVLQNVLPYLYLEIY